MNSENEKRDRELLIAYTDQHMTLDAIGKAYGITRERVRQIITLYPEYLEERARRITSNRSFVPCRNACGKENFVKNNVINKPYYCSKACLYAYREKKMAAVREKLCTQCKTVKSIDDFYPSYGSGVKGTKAPACKICFYKREENWRVKHLDMVKITNDRAMRAYMHRIKTDPEKLIIYKKRCHENYLKIKADPIRWKKYSKVHADRYAWRMIHEPGFREHKNELSRLRMKKKRALMNKNK